MKALARYDERWAEGAEHCEQAPARAEVPRRAASCVSGAAAVVRSVEERATPEFPWRGSDGAVRSPAAVV
jgi:hypothetical protein